jgi:hypothetical protein
MRRVASYLDFGTEVHGVVDDVDPVVKELELEAVGM